MGQQDNNERDRVWRSLYDNIRERLRSVGRESATGRGDFWLVDDNYGWTRHTVYLFNLERLSATLIADLHGLLRDQPGWEIVLVVDVIGKENEWPSMGVIIRQHEIIDGLIRSHLPEPQRSMVSAGSRHGSGDD